MNTSKNTLSSRALEAGRAAGLAAGNWLADSVQAIGEIIPANMTPAQYRTIRAEWCKGYAETFGCKQVTAENQWAKVWKGVEAAFAVKKPQTEAAKKKAAQRAKAKAAAASAAPEAPAKGGEAAASAPAKGEEAAQSVKLELSKLEAHIISLLRAARYKAAIDCIHQLAEAAAA